MPGFNRKLIETLHNQNYQVRITSIDHLVDLETEILSRKKEGRINELLYHQELKQFFSFAERLSEAKSLIIIAIPHPMTVVRFYYKENLHATVVPPTYLSRRDESKLTTTLTTMLNSAGYSTIIANNKLPLKLLAVKSGMGKYGRNNICYIPGMGSFHRLVAFFSDLPVAEDYWQQAQMLEKCESCLACLKNCPTGCIQKDQFMIKAEQCLTFVNESSDPFPEWVDSSWHNALIGCMQCQLICPENKSYLSKVDPGLNFSKEETTNILNNAHFEQIPLETKEKIRALEMAEFYQIFRRNLSVLIN
ncbi:MAG: hypothetical protein MI740_02805 [Halanaerobiales bacterium]|nr:hypothetical protein [Halanaerobiales bacterium]